MYIHTHKLELAEQAMQKHNRLTDRQTDRQTEGEAYLPGGMFVAQVTPLDQHLPARPRQAGPPAYELAGLRPCRLRESARLTAVPPLEVDNLALGNAQEQRLRDPLIVDVGFTYPLDQVLSFLFRTCMVQNSRDYIVQCIVQNCCGCIAMPTNWQQLRQQEAPALIISQASTFAGTKLQDSSNVNAQQRDSEYSLVLHNLHT